MNGPTDPINSSKRLIMGIDPGLTGAIAVLNTQTMTLEDMIDMPLYKTASKARKQGYLEHINLSTLSISIDQYAQDTLFAIIEAPKPRPGQGAGSTFRFGKFCGQVEGVLAANYIPTMPISSAGWKTQMGLSKDKQDSIDMASKHWPESKHLWKLKKHNDRAEAALMALYGFRTLKGAKI